jgi:hypothetical protein
MPNLELQPTFIQMPALAEMGAPAPAPAPDPSPVPGFPDMGGDGPAFPGMSGDGPAPTLTAPPGMIPGVPGSDGASAPVATDWMNPGSNGPAVDTTNELPPVTTAPRAVRRDDGGMMMIYFWVALVPYAIFMTIIAVILYFKQPVERNPLDPMPDVMGERPGASKAKDKSKKGSTIIFDRVPPDYKLMDKSKVALGDTIRLGDLEVTPTKVEQKHVVFKERSRRFDPTPATEDSLVLHVTLKNVSDEWCWYPTDPAFDAAWKPGQPLTSRPYTFLELVDKRDENNKRFFGGAFEWPPVRRQGEAPILEYVEGQEEHDKELCPGESMTTVFFTDPKDDVTNFLSSYRGKLVWRLHLRRGVVTVKDDKNVSTTGVIGVEFNKDDIK